MKVFQFCSIDEWLVKNLFKRQVYLNEPDNFNDPTENNFTIEKYSASESKKKEYKQDLLSSLMGQDMLKKAIKNKNNDFFSYSQWLEELKGIEADEVLNVEDNTLKEFAYYLIKRMQKECRISCFTTRLFNPLMWGHYAAGMRGVCLEYDIDKEDLYKVRYGRSYSVSIPNLLAGSAKGEVINTFLRKSKDWSYEDEYRMIREEECYPLDRDQLRNIYFGYKSDVNRVEFVKEVAESSYGNNIGFYVARNSIYDHSIQVEQVAGNENLSDVMEREKLKVGRYDTLSYDKDMADFVSYLSNQD